MIYYFPEIPGTLVIAVLMVVVGGLLLYWGIIAACIVAKLLWLVIQEPCRVMYFDYLDWKKDRVRKRKKKTKWYEDYSKFK